LKKLIGIVLVGALALSAWADDSLSKIKDAGVLNVGLAAAYPPFESRNEKTGQIEGFDIDFANEIVKRIGVDVKIHDAEWPALLGGLKKGDYDAIISCMSKQEASVERVNMSKPYYDLLDVVVVGKDAKILSHGDLANKIIGVQTGSGSEQQADQLAKKIDFKEIKRYNYNPEAFLDLKNGRIDAVIVGYAYAVRQKGFTKNYKILEEPIASSEIIVVMRPGADQLTDAINNALADIKKSGVYDQLVDKWLTFK
jgi:polar amino acid transport system substrate-binding protein